MRTWVRLLAVWWIVIALPVQGIAGVTMAHCGPQHQRMAAGTASAAHAGRHDAAPHDHAVAADHATVSAHGSAHGSSDPSPDDLSGLGQYKCSVCAACCAGAAPPSAAPRLPQCPAMPAAFAEQIVAVDAFASDGPDRPPRPRLV